MERKILIIDDLVSKNYLKQLVAYNQAGHGKTGYRWADVVARLINDRAQGISTVLDYGCGQGTLMNMIKQRVYNADLYEYDPAVSGKDTIPDKPVDLVVCTDVLEHIEPDKIDAVLRHIVSLTGKIAFFVISTRLAVLTLSNGKNAHVLVKPPNWWLLKINRVYSCCKITSNSHNRDKITVLVYR